MGVLAPTNGPVIILTHTGAPNIADGIFTKGAQAMDTADVLYVCTAAGNPGTWVTVSAGGGGSVLSVFTRTGAVVAANGDYSVGQVTGAAPLASPALTGVPTAPTAAPGDNTTQIATDAFVYAAVAPLAPLASPALTGSPTAPTQTPGDNTTKIATDAFVTAAITAALALTVPAGALVAASESTNSTIFVALTTPGPAVSITTKTTALVLLSTICVDASIDYMAMGFDISGATTKAANLNQMAAILANANAQTANAAIWVTGLTAGVNTFTAKYRVAGFTTGTWSNRYMTVIPGPT